MDTGHFFFSTENEQLRDQIKFFHGYISCFDKYFDDVKIIND